MPLSAGSAVLGATKSRALNRLAYDIANKANDITTAATGDKLLMVDVSADYELKYADADNVLETMGVSATSAEIDRVSDASARVITTALTVLSLTVTQHGERILLVNSNSAGASTFRLPAATGSGVKFTIRNNVAQTQGTVVFTVVTGDVLKGKCIALDATAAADAMVFLTTATSAKCTLNLTTTGGLGHDTFDAVDVATGVYMVDVVINGSGSMGSPFTHTVG